ncbi:unnamed protein product [Effrenium voratum]|uniref:Uncharacterized protein n=1 Tax=Effrenium voratum TaxID=2562239 RepID=A0AA36NDG9_9DINO|nr:unnamed protein product [Effrenium voratum]
MYDPAGMLVALAGLSANDAQADALETKLLAFEPLIAAPLRTEAMKAEGGGEGGRSPG